MHSATPPPPGMNCFAGLVNRWSVPLWSRDQLQLEPVDSEANVVQRAYHVANGMEPLQGSRGELVIRAEP